MQKLAPFSIQKKFRKWKLIQVFSASLLVATGAAMASEIPIIDAHSQLDKEVGVQQALSVMEQAGVSRVILSSLRGNAKTKEIVGASRDNPDRIIASIGMKGGVKDGDGDAIKTLTRQGSSTFFGAMSEVMIFHMQKGNKAPEIVRTQDDPEATLALEIARTRGWPYVVHIEFDYARSVGQYEKMMKELEKILAQAGDHPVALTHMGQLKSAEVSQLISSFKNIYFLTSHANTEFLSGRENRNPHWVNLFAGSSLATEWRSLVVAHPDRFILAFDNVYNDDWNEKYVRQVKLWKSALRDLPEAVAHKVAHENAESLWHISPANK